MTWDYLLTAFIVCVSPGIGVVFTLSSTLGGDCAQDFGRPSAARWRRSST